MAVRRPMRPLVAASLRGVVAWAVLVVIIGGALVQGRGAAHATGEGEVRGGSVYAANCTVCHGVDGAGVQGTDRTAGPPLRDVDAAYVDMVIRTGRMPLHAPEVGVVPPRDGLPAEQREALVTWMVDEFGIPDSRPPTPIRGDVARGHELYGQHCAQCHGATGVGGVSGEGTQIRPVIGVDAVAAVEAMRVGPFRMPAFGEGQLDDDDVGDIAVFVASLDERGTTPLGLFEIDRVAMALLALALGVVAFAIVLLAAHPVDLARQPAKPPEEGHR